MEQNRNIRLGHGSGGKLTHDLVNDLFLKHFDNEILWRQGDSGIFPQPGRREEFQGGKKQSQSDVNGFQGGSIAFSTDAYVVDPIFFPGGNIGSLAVSGTVNDISVTGARPLYLSAAFILEEGLPLDQLEAIVREMGTVARDAGVQIIAGDTKVVNKGKCDKVFITTAGVGFLEHRFSHIPEGNRIRTGDKIIVNGYVGDHGIAILGERESLSFSSPVLSDAACLNGLIEDVLSGHDVHFMRDATRGGLATVLAELARMAKSKSSRPAFGVHVDESAIPVHEEVRGICEVFGYDPLYMANEGKVVMVVPPDQADGVLSVMQDHPLGNNSAIIGTVTDRQPGKVVLSTEIGGRRFLDMLAGEQLPRIC